jgi:AraC-like DNA-binding protein
MFAHLSASDAAYNVGYSSPSQFSREYRRFFGVPPSVDVQTCQQVD